MTIATAIPSVSHRRADGDTTVVVAFRPTDPLGLTLVEIEDGDDLSPAEVLGVLAETLARLHVYADDYRAALREDQGAHGALIPATPAPAGPRLACLHCGHAWSWIPRVIEGGRDE